MHGDSDVPVLSRGAASVLTTLFWPLSDRIAPSHHGAPCHGHVGDLLSGAVPSTYRPTLASCSTTLLRRSILGGKSICGRSSLCLGMRYGEKQAALLGCIFMLVFSAYLTIQGFASQLYGETLASDMELVLYAMFTVACFGAPAVVNMLGPRLALFLGIQGYAALVLASLVFAVSKSSWCRALIISGGSATGIGAALVWTAQGRLLYDWSDGTNTAHLFAIFWGIFNCSAVLGGFLSFAYFSRASVSAPWPLYALFLALIVLGACCIFVLSAGKSKGAECGLEGVQPRLGASWRAELRLTLRLFVEREMAALAPLFFYTGFNQPYQLNTFGDRHFSPQLLGLELVVFYASEIVGGFVASKMLEPNVEVGVEQETARPQRQLRRAGKRRAAIRTLALFGSVTACGYAFALAAEAQNGRVARIDVGDSAAIGPTAAFALWGFSDSQVQSYAFWLIGCIYDGPRERSRAMGYYKMLQSLGWCAGFALIPSERLRPIWQLYLTAASFTIGTAISACALPSNSDAPVTVAHSGSQPAEVRVAVDTRSTARQALLQEAHSDAQAETTSEAIQ